MGQRLAADPTGHAPGEAATPLPRDGLRAELPRLLRGASGTVLLQAVSTGTGFLVSLLAARFLGSSEFGRYAFSFAWAGLIGAFVTLGLDRFLVRGLATMEIEQNWSLMKGLLRRTNQAVLLTSMACCVGGWLIALLCLGSDLRYPFGVAMLLIPFTALTLVRQGAMQAFGQVVLGQVPEYFLRPLLILAGLLALRFLDQSLLSALSLLEVNCAAVIVAFLVGALLLRSKAPAAMRSARPTYAMHSWLRASLPMMVISGVWILNNYVGTLVAGTLKGPEVAGTFSIIQSGSALIILFLVATNMPLAPLAARLYATGEMRSLEQVTERVARIGLALSAPVCAALALYPGAFLGIFGSTYRDGAAALTIVALAQLVNAASGPAGNVLMMTHHENAAVRAIAVGAAINLCVGVALVPPFGIDGSAVAFAGSLIAWNVLLVLMARKHLGINVTAFKRLALSPPAEDG